MWRGWGFITFAAFVGCGKTGLFTPAPDTTAAGNGGGGNGGSTAAGGGPTGAGGTGATGTGGEGGSGSSEVCTALCCDGTSMSGPSSDPQECALSQGLACEAHGGPFSITLGEGPVWQATNACPTLRPCEVNCCSGDELPAGPSFDPMLCAMSGAKSGKCDDHGGVALVRFDEQVVMQDLSCDGNCQAGCCSGRVAFSDQPLQHDCEVWAGRMCDLTEGGAAAVAHEGALLWTAGGQCPSVRSCQLVCDDGAKELIQRHQAKVCVTESLASAFCTPHGGPATILFDGQVVWKAP